MNIILLSAIGVIFTSYILFILKVNRWKPLHSISDSWYILKERDKGEEALFTAFIFGIGGCLMFLFPLSQYFFYSGAILSFVGSATTFKSTEGLTDEIHYGGAIGGIALSILGLMDNSIYFPLWIMIGGTPIIFLLTKKEDTYIFWVEILAFLSIIGGLITLL